MQANSTAKPEKPYPDFPLYPHASRRWAKKIRGQTMYFGPWDDADGALQKYLDTKDALHAGRKPREDAEAATVKGIVNAFLNTKLSARDAGEIGERMFADYKEACDCIIAKFGKARLVSDLRPDDFASLRKSMSKRWGATRLGNVINRVRAVFKHASDNGIIDRPVVYGSLFKRPSAKTLRIEKAKKGANLFTRDEIRSMLDATEGQLHAMILLGINAGFGNADCGALSIDAVDLDKAVIDFPRPKTGVARRCILWPKTVEALRSVIAERPTPKDAEHTGLVFITKYGKPWKKGMAGGPISQEIGKLLRSLKINGREGLGFYTLRHNFRTVADETLDRPAIDLVMGHTDASMGGRYREHVADTRLQRVAEHVRGWLFGEEGGAS